ncbi:Rne/Rng family ribonuclease [Shouchella miscanthi]|uniref:Rne/Rng family ribonuclease n=1 Tax=Shouchella miscanthi TaxID=2598861 RepID=UPI001643B503|nr:Rne/Rng family ribonuclease [Shouchella miscanthi]
MAKTIRMKKTALKREAVVIDDHEKVVEWYIESEFISNLVGSVFKAKVEKVMPNMQAAFVSIGGEKNGFLHRDELLAFQRDARQGNEERSINQYVKAGTEIIVQVTKESDGTKGPRLTEIISLPGHALVYLPEGHGVSISKKIREEETRQSLAEHVTSFLQGEEGVIVRTQGEKATLADIEEEMRFLRALWKRTQTDQSQVPSQLFQGSSLIEQLIKRQSNDELHEWIVDDYDDFQMLKQLLPASLKERVRLTAGSEDVFLSVSGQLHKALRRHLWLKNGGYLIFDETEALTVVDVNSGKYTKKATKPQMAFEVNQQAAVEICRQLRLRNYSGMILIDFIEMESEKAQRDILKRVEKELLQDHIKTSVKGFTKLGMLELTRRKASLPMADMLQETCPTCQGSGRILTNHGFAFQLENELAQQRGAECMLIQARPELVHLFHENDEAVLKRLEYWLNSSIILLSTNQLPVEKPYDILFQGDEQAAKKRLKTLTNND